MTRHSSDRDQPSTNQHEPRQRHDQIDARESTAALRSLPSVEEIRQNLATRTATWEDTAPAQSALVSAVRAAIAHARVTIQEGGPTPSRSEILADAERLLRERLQPRLRPVINAAGAILNTNLGRAPLSQRAIQRISEIANGYSNLEFDLETGERGSRQSHTRGLLREMTGAEDAIVVNNNAAATLLTLAALASGREVIVSRGELVEIGGGFRVPDILAQSGARLVEVGTTNRVRLTDYAGAITPDTALILSVHPSNFRIIGFTQTPDLADLADLAHKRDIPLVRDLGSGAVFATSTWGLERENTITDCVRAGVDVTCFSGDKLLGGPQAGIIAGKRALLERIERHPLMRAVRCDKLTLAALEATLQAYQEETALNELPIWRAITAPLETIRARAQRWVGALEAMDVSAEVVTGETAIGGGSLPGETLPTALCAIPANRAVTDVDLTLLAQHLRLGDPAVVARILHGQALFDPRTVAPEQDDALVAAIARAWRATSAPYA